MTVICEQCNDSLSSISVGDFLTIRVILSSLTVTLHPGIYVQMPLTATEVQERDT